MNYKKEYVKLVFNNCYSAVQLPTAPVPMSEDIIVYATKYTLPINRILSFPADSYYCIDPDTPTPLHDTNFLYNYTGVNELLTRKGALFTYQERKDDHLHVYEIPTSTVMGLINSENPVSCFSSYGSNSNLLFTIHDRENVGNTLTAPIMGLEDILANLRGEGDPIDPNDLTVVALPYDIDYNPSTPEGFLPYRNMGGFIGYTYKDNFAGQLYTKVVVDGVFKTFVFKADDLVVLKRFSPVALPEASDRSHSVLAFSGDGEIKRCISNTLNGSYITSKNYLNPLNYNPDYTVSFYHSQELFYGLKLYCESSENLDVSYTDRSTLAEMGHRHRLRLAEEMGLSEGSLIVHIENMKRVHDLFISKDAITVADIKLPMDQFIEKLKVKQAEIMKANKLRARKAYDALDLKSFIGSKEEKDIDNLKASIRRDQLLITNNLREIEIKLADNRELTQKIADKNSQLAAAQGIIHSLDNVCEEFEKIIQQCDLININDNRLYIETEEIHLTFDGTTLNLGTMLIEFNFLADEVQNFIKVHRGRNTIISDSNYFHPHVAFSNYICYGDALPQMYESFMNLELNTLLTYVRSLLQTFNAQSPYLKWSKLQVYANPERPRMEMGSLYKELLTTDWEEVECYE